MSTRKNFYFRQRVTEAEFDAAFDDLEQADHDLAADLGFVGVLANAVVSPHAPVPNLTVDVSGPGSVLDQQGQRIFFSSLQNVNVAQDDNGVSTEVSVAGKEKIVSVFVKFDRTLSDPRIDGNSLTVFFRRDESFKFSVAQGAEAAAGAAVPPPLRSDAILLADVIRRFGQAQVGDDAISLARRQDAFVISGAPRFLRRGRTREALADLLGFYNAHALGTADRHAAAAINYAGGAPWADGTTNPAATVEAQLDKLVNDLAADAGAARLGAGARTSWLDGRTNPAGVSLFAALNKIITDLTDQAAGADGAGRIGAQAIGHLPAGSVRSQLDALDATSVRANVANVFSATQTLNGPAGDTAAAMATTARPATRKLLWEIAGAADGYSYRIYATSRTLEFTLNARWNGMQWEKDSTALASAKFELNHFEIRINTDDSMTSPFNDSWTSSVGIGVAGHLHQAFDAGGNWTSPGPTETYIGWQGFGSNGNTNIGSGAPFRKMFPAVPSSITFVTLSALNVIAGPFAIFPTTAGTGANMTVAAPNANANFYTRVIAS
jgi:hypothetical protein